MFRLREEIQTGIMLLDHKSITNDGATYHSRVICVRPDVLITHREIILVWPQENHDGGMAEVKLVIVSEGEPT